MAILGRGAFARWGRILAAGLWWLLLPAAVAQPIAREYQVKAVFLFNFTQFVEWPAAAFPAPNAPLIIGIMGDDPIGPFLEEAIRDEKAGDHPLELRRFQRGEPVDCHVFYLNRSETNRLGPMLDGLGGKPVLTVSDADFAARRGAMIRFLNENNRIRLRINLEAARRSNLTISSKLLRSAEIVKDTR